MSATAVLESVRENRALAGSLMPILHGIQDRLGWVPPRAVPLIAFELNLSRAEVHGVLTFYHYFRAEQTGTAGDLSVSCGSLPGGRRRDARGARQAQARRRLSRHQRAMAASRSSRSTAWVTAPAGLR